LPIDERLQCSKRFPSTVIASSCGSSQGVRSSPRPLDRMTFVRRKCNSPHSLAVDYRIEADFQSAMAPAVKYLPASAPPRARSHPTPRKESGRPRSSYTLGGAASTMRPCVSTADFFLGDSLCSIIPQNDNSKVTVRLQFGNSLVAVWLQSGSWGARREFAASNITSGHLAKDSWLAWAQHQATHAVQAAGCLRPRQCRESCYRDWSQARLPLPLEPTFPSTTW
jgi:hypothetical protein